MITVDVSKIRYNNNIYLAGHQNNGFVTRKKAAPIHVSPVTSVALLAP